jgi:pyruvate,water dikinase
MSELVVGFDEIGRGDGARVGGKGANLGELVRIGVRVPPGFIVTAEAYRSYIAQSGLMPRIEAELSTIDKDHLPSLEAAGKKIEQLFSGVAMPHDIAAAIASAYEGLGRGHVAVRSSATAEDLAEASFAGQQSTFLNVQGEAGVVDAVRSCWASLFEGRAISYRARAGFGHDVAIAVVVQSMVQSERSGVMFTVNPVTNDAGQLIIEAVFGLGEACVSGFVTPDTYIVDKASLELVEKVVSEQDRELVADPGGDQTEPNVWLEIPAERRGLQKLTDAQVRALAELGKLVEAHYGAPQDTEWALMGESFYLLQARPVTTFQV